MGVFYSDNVCLWGEGLLQYQGPQVSNGISVVMWFVLRWSSSHHGQYPYVYIVFPRAPCMSPRLMRRTRGSSTLIGTVPYMSIWYVPQLVGRKHMVSPPQYLVGLGRWWWMDDLLRHERWPRHVIDVFPAVHLVLW